MAGRRLVRVASRYRVLLTGTLLVAYLGLVLALTMWPTPVDQGFAAEIERVLRALHRRGVPRSFGYRELEFSANVALFIPLGFLAALTLPRRLWWLSLLAVPAASVLMEEIQARWLVARVGALSDVVANTLGAWLGTALALAARALARSRAA